MISTQHWPQVKALFSEAIELPQSQRAPFLLSQVTEPELLVEVYRLIDLDERAGRFLEEGFEPPAAEPPIACGPEPEDVVAARYSIQERIGSGGMCGGVYRALDLTTGELVALKVTADLREFFTARAIEHPNVCKMLDCGKDGARSFFTMELLRGVTLEQHLASHGAVTTWRSLASQLCAALKATHEAGVLHLDLKPANIFLTHSGRVVLIDFGLARMGCGEGRQSSGTLSYMAPELLMGRPATPRSDLYSLGVVLHQAATGELPIEGFMAEGCLHMDPAKRPASVEAAVRLLGL